MALITCPECGKKISDKAEACVGCGYPLNMKEKKYIDAAVCSQDFEEEIEKDAEEFMNKSTSHEMPKELSDIIDKWEKEIEDRFKDKTLSKYFRYSW